MSEAFPDGVYSIADSATLEDRTTNGHRLVKILSGPHSMQFLLQRGRDQVHEALRESLAEMSRRMEEERRKAWDLRSELDKAQRDINEGSQWRQAIERARDAAIEGRKTAEGERDALEHALGDMRRQLAQVAVVFGEDGAKLFEEHLVELATAAKEGRNP